jgi:predicted DNA-binding transcriptional regulator YafY
MASTSAAIRDSWQLQWWILSQGDGIEIIAPKALRKAIGDSLKSAGEYY